MFSCARGVKTLPGMHCNYVLRTFLELVTRFKHNNGQQVAIDCNRSVIQVALILFQIGMTCSVELLGSGDMQMYGDPYVAQKG